MTLIRHLHDEKVRVFELDRSRIVDAELAAQSTFEVNVGNHSSTILKWCFPGGTLFQSSKKNISHQPNSLLFNVFSGRFEVSDCIFSTIVRSQTPKDHNNNVFFDRY